jgi:hypothetical protein
MENKDLIDLKPIWIKEIPNFNEKNIQEYVASDPKVLGLGDLILKDKERRQAHAGRLDLLLQHPEINQRYEVEIQLGKTDESHIIRTIEYWDLERRTYRQFDHCAVIIAEDITTRFLNVIQLFNGHIPLIAIQMRAYKIGDKVALIFTKVLDKVEYEIEENDDVLVPTDRNFWLEKGTKETLEIVDEIYEIIKEIDPTISLKYNKYYIGLSINGIAFNFSQMEAKKSNALLCFKYEKDDEIDKIIEENDFNTLDYYIPYSQYRIKLTKAELNKKREIIKNLLIKSYEYYKK